jgi:hypothetical protein
MHKNNEWYCKCINNMGVEFEYFYSYTQNFLNFYNFTQSSVLRLWWFQSKFKIFTQKNE